MKVAIIGSGFMGRTHAEAFNQMDDVELVGIYTTSRHPDKVDGYGSNVYTNLEEMIETTNPDIVSVCLPTHLHKKYVIKAANMGRHIICEKPIALSLEDANEMIAYCEEKQVKLFIGHVLRFFPQYEQIKKLVHDGEVGELGVLHARRANDHPGVNNKWYSDFSKSGGVTLDLIIHDLDFMRYLNGEVESVYALNKRNEHIDHVFVTLQFENGVIGHVEGLWGAPGGLEFSLDVFGSQGTLRVSDEHIPIKLKKNYENTVGLNPFAEDPYYIQLKHFIHCIKNNNQPIVTTADAVEAIKLSLAATYSAQIGEPVVLNDFSGIDLDKGGE